MSTTLLDYVAVYHDSGTDGALCHLHAPDCADLTRSPRNRNAVKVTETLDLGHLSAHLPQLDPDELGYSERDVRVHHCAQRAHEAAQAETTPQATTSMKNVKLKRGTRVHSAALNGRPVCRPTGDADKFEATSKPVSCTSCLAILGQEPPAEEPKPTRTRRKAQPVTTTKVAPQRAKGSGAQAAETAAKPRRSARRVTTPAATPQPTTAATSPRKRRNGAAQEAAAAQAQQIITDAVATVKTASGDRASWDATRSPKCNDEDYALAVQVRELRHTGEAWWKIAHILGLPGNGPTVKQGKTGAAHARRLWERAWGKTYKETNTPRETKAVKKERVVTHEARPFFSEDLEDQEVIDAVSGQPITWYTRVGTNGGAVVSEQVAEVHVGSAKIVQGPKGRVLEFDERIYETTTGGGVKTPMVGPRRSVYVDRIEKVGV